VTRRRRLLLISYHFPPRSGVASVRLRNLVRNLPEHGWDVDVVAGPVGADPDETLLEGTEPTRVVRVEPLRRVPGLQGADWAAASLRAARSLAREADVVMISGGPFAPFRYGRRLGRPYVLDFRDPWSWEPRFGRLDRRLRRLVAAALERRAEAVAVRRAAAVVTVAAEITEGYRRLYPTLNGRIETLPHGWEAADFADPAPPPSEIPELVYAGSFLPGERTPELVIDLARLVRARGVPLRVRLVGSLPAELRSQTAAAESEGWVEVTGLVSHRAAISALRRAAILWAQPGDLPFLITGKVYEYLAANRPIVAAAPADGALAHLLETTGGAIVVDPEPAASADSVVAALAGGAAPRRPDAIAALAARHISARLASILERAAG
jgi:glycosyltransferase involved in cell wall biosynthesis